MNDAIIQFIKKQTCATICCTDKDGDPYCFSCFYAFNREKGLLYYKSSPSAKHSIIMSRNPIIAGTILPDKLNILQIKGIQFEGVLLAADDPLSEKATLHYYARHPIALTMPGDTCVVKLNSIKMTDSSLGIGKKISWSRNELIAG
jgi:uncharacterized protein YhbP (UPF0306 family)